MRVLFVSKPIAPPFHDGTKCLVRDVATHLTDVEPHVMSLVGASGLAGGVRHARVVSHAVYGDAGAFTPTLRANARAAMWLLVSSRADVWHFVFAPNSRTSAAGRWLRRIRRVPVVQTIASPPRSFEGIGELLFGDVVVAQSEHTKARALERCGTDAPRIEVIPPPVAPVSRRSGEALRAMRHELDIPDDAECFVYPGDLETSIGAETVAGLVGPIVSAIPNAVIVFACRAKTSEAPRIQERIASRLDPKHVRFAGEISDLLALVQQSAAVLFPVDELAGKVDLPISLLEAMTLGVPVITFDHGPLADLDGTLRARLGDREALAQHSVQVVSDRRLRARVIAEQREAVEGRFAAAVVARQYERLYLGIGS